MDTTDQHLRVLYIDDDEMALTITQIQLMRAGIDVEVTSDALEAVGIMASQGLDLILLDSVMPTIDGVEFLQLMRSLQIELPVVFLTGHGVEELRAAVREFTVLDVLDKQADRMELPHLLQGLYKTHMDQEIKTGSALGGLHAAS